MDTKEEEVFKDGRGEQNIDEEKIFDDRKAFRGEAKTTETTLTEIMRD